MEGNKKAVTMYLDKDVVNKAKHYALDESKSLSEIVEKLLKQMLGLK